MTNYIKRAVLSVFVLTGVPALAHAQLPNTCDFDGDLKTDAVIVRDVGGQLQWWISRSQLGTQVTNWGTAGDTALCGDYDADGKSDVTVWRPGAPGVAGFWVLQSSNGVPFFEAFGQTGDNPKMVGDYNGDNRDDFAVYRPSNSITFFRTAQGGPIAYVPWGLPGDVAAPFDYDGDGKQDPMVRRSNGQIWILKSSNGTTAVINFGLTTDLIALGNWDGDLTEDLAIVRNGVYWTLGSSTGTVTVRRFGLSTDLVTQGDWDGDGVTDLAIWRPTTGQYWLNRTTAGLAVVSWGDAGDIPVGNWRVK